MNGLKIFTFLVISLAIACNSPRERIIDRFREVNETLERTDSILMGSDNRTDSTARDLKSAGFDDAVADSLGNLFIQTRAYLIHLKDELKKADSKGEKLDVAQNLLINTAKGDSLYKYMSQLYEAGIKYGDSTATLLLYKDIKKLGKDKWLERYFKMVPTVAAITILSNFQSDLGNIKHSLVNAALQRLKNKISSEAN